MLQGESRQAFLSSTSFVIERMILINTAEPEK
jgi:hypothetical protein